MPIEIAPGARLGPYEITAKLGEGGMGEVYRATDTNLKRDVAIKVLPQGFTEDKERLARFEREAQLLAQLHHPNIASIFGLEVAEGTRALVMELVEGPTLAERLEQGPLPFNESLSISLQIAHALEEAHEKGIVHRDLKPQNVKASIEGKVKVLDFGLAKAMDPAAGSAASAADMARSPTIMQSPTLTAAHGTQLGVILGTAAYMAPEQARGGLVDKRADIWAFGVVLYEMLAGRTLFAAETVSDTLAGVLKTEIDFSRLPPATPTAMRALLRRCLERNPKNRLHDIADARIVIEELITSGGREETIPAAAIVPPRGVSRRELVAWSAALLAAVAALALLAGRSGEPGGAAVSAPVTRFSLVPEEKGNLRDFPALSPDGRTLVYSLTPEQGSAALWAYSFDSGTSRRIAGTEDGAQPFWSPDGRQLGFFAAGQLKRLDLATGLGQNLGRVADPRGGSWTREGELLVSRNSAIGIEYVSASSGERRPATRLTADRGEQSHRFPWALPGGEFLYTVTGSPEVTGVYWHPGGDAAPKKILKDQSRAAYDERGFLVWVRDTVLVAQPFDAAKGELSGELFPLAERVGVDEQMAAATWFAVSAAGTVALRTGFAQSTELVWVDRGGAALGTLASASAYREPMVSPDGRQVATQIVDPTSPDDVWIYDASGLDRSRRLTFDPSSADTPIWSPEGRWIAYTSARATGYALFRKATDGSGEEELLFEAGTGSWIDSWSPDGRSLLFERFTTEGSVDLWFLPLDGQRKAVPFLQTAANEGHAMFSPDGRFVAYVSDESGIGQVYVRTVAPSESRWQISKSGGDWPAWSSDGRELFFAATDRMLHAVPILGLSPFSFGTPAPLFRLRTPEPKITSNRTYFGVAPDGRRFLINQLVGDEGDARIDVVMNWSPPSKTR